MISGIVGLPGAGKSLLAVKWLVKNALSGRRRSLANFHCRVGDRYGRPLWEFGLWDDIASAGNCLAVIDEAHMWFSAREWTKTAQSELAVFQQSRKEGLDLVWIAQHEARVDVAIREVTAFIYRVRRIGRFHVISKFTPDDMRKPLGRSISPVDTSLFKYYDSAQRIGRRDGEGYTVGASAALASQTRAAVAIVNGRPALMPTHYRIQVTINDVRFVRADDPELSEIVRQAWRAHRLAGWEGGCTFLEPLVWDAGRMLALDPSGVPELIEAPRGGILGLAEQTIESVVPKLKLNFGGRS